MAQNFDGGNIDEFDEFLSIHQHFTHQNFLLITFCYLPAIQTTFLYRVLSLLYVPMQLFSLSTISYISMVAEQKCQFPVTSYLFHWLLVL